MAQTSSDSGEPTSLTRSTVRGVFWITTSRLLKAPINLLALAVLARLLSPADFGIVAIGLVIASFSDVLVDGSFGMVLIQRRELHARLIGATLVLSAGLATLVAAVIIVAAPFIQQEFDFPQLREVLIYFCAIMPITAITTVTTALIQRALKFGLLTFNTFVSQLAYTSVAIALALEGMGLWSLVWGHIAGLVVNAFLGFLAVRRQYHVEISTSALRDVLSQGGMFTVSKLLNWAAGRIDQIIVGRFLGAADLGLYSRAATLMTTARQLTGAGPVRVLFSSFAKIQDNRDRMRNGYLRALSVSLIVASLGSAFIIVNAEFIVRLLLGPRWLATVPIIQILFSAFIARSGYVIAESVPLALGLGRQAALRQGAQVGMVLIGATAGARFGVVGAAIGVSTARWLFYGVCLLLVRNLLQVRWSATLRIHLNSILVALPPVAAALATKWMLPINDLILSALPAVVFGLVSAVVISAGTDALLGGDVVRARNQVWRRFRRVSRI